MILPGKPFPNLLFNRPDGSSLEMHELRKKEHALLLFIQHPHPDIFAFVGRFQDEAKVFEWLQTRLIPVFAERSKIPTPWPAPQYPACLYSEPLPEGLEWGKGYLVSRQRTLYSVYGELPM